MFLLTFILSLLLPCQILTSGDEATSDLLEGIVDIIFHFTGLDRSKVRFHVALTGKQIRYITAPIDKGMSEAFIKIHVQGIFLSPHILMVVVPLDIAVGNCICTSIQHNSCLAFLI